MTMDARTFGEKMLELVTADWVAAGRTVTLLEAFHAAIGDNDPDGVEDHPIWFDTMNALDYEYEDIETHCEMCEAAVDMVLRVLRATTPGVMA